MEGYLTKRNALAALTLLIFLVAWNREINLLYGMSALVGATLLIAFLLAGQALKGVTAVRLLPATASEEETIEMELVVENAGRAGRYMIELIDLFPAGAPAHRRPMTFIAELPGRKRREYRTEVVCDKRGEYRIGPLKIASAYPLGISSVEKTMPDSCPTLLVYPKLFPIARLPLISGAAFPMSGVEAISKGGGSEDFFGTREYRRGDSLKYVHWPSTARRGEMIVKEFEIRAATEVTLLLDLDQNSSVGERRETTLEYAVKIAGSITQYALDRGHDVQLIGYNRKGCYVPAGRGTNQLAAVLEALARVESDGAVSYPSALVRSAPALRDGATAVLFFLRSDHAVEETLHGVALLAAKRIRPISIFFDPETFLRKTASPTPRRNRLADEMIARGEPVYFVSKGDRLAEIFT